MFCFGRTLPLAVLLIWGAFAAESNCTDKNQKTQNSSSIMTEVNTTVQMGTKALLCCPSIPLTEAVLITWTITPRGQSFCVISYRVDTRDINETNCSNRSITWVFTPDLSPYLQISAVSLQHEGHYSCDIALPDGNFQKDYDLQVLVPPEVTNFPGKNRTAVCEAIAGKPAAQISWTPDGDCVTKNESHSNGTVTVRSTCHWEQNNVSTVSCWVYHSTGNKTLVIELSRGGAQLLGSYILYTIPSIIILIIIGCICLLKISGFRKCKLPKSEATPAAEEDEMQPYASYTEKSNPLYDTVTKVEACPGSQGEVNGTDWLTLPATGV
ncbi:cell surface glycoprotein CD200 receptor 1-like isoform X2 [Apodemus sylvaticus]|uniref:cell surface glycoprotein CD200 receptor 1-like isoform X2 n=1 Tax=Apodemus sylvaticus TaxID=10129 RepID=UPI002244B2E2|nr:cell surface glycoprotein CD200 receptor 1-like isoform X2 [Apodemus sylvaticus]